MVSTTYIYPGTFNPFHQGHKAVVQAVRRRYPTARVVVVPTGTPPHRLHQSLVAAHHRLHMAQLALSDLNGVEVSDVECRSPGPHYTALTIQALMAEHPNWDPLTLVLGEDALNSLPSWHQADWIIQHVPLFALCRPDVVTAPHPTLIPVLEWVAQPVHPASASQIRHMLSQNIPIPDGWLDPEVSAYIQQHGLYR